MSHAELDRIVRRGMKGSVSGWRFYVATNLLALLAAIVLGLVNVAMYRGNPPMLAAELGATLAAGVLLVFGVHVFRELQRIARVDEPLMDALRRRLAFVRSKYELWLWAAALTCLLLVFTLTTFIDNQNGVYRINQPLVFWGTLAAMLLFIYGTGKLASYAPVREMRDALEDLQEGTTERIRATPARRRVVFWLTVAAVLLLTATAILGMLTALGL
ncbi:MAG: hypothetical protein OES32_02095 [Acidobacteriota bacterium]|nr:hypothetical protein [Acidobacteriota bacterium]MDH3522351.1 hypothetical protein [Acidobacteriota bacterium]